MKKITIILILLLFSKLLSAQLSHNKYSIRSTIFTETDTIDCYLPYDDIFESTIKYKLSKEDKNKDKKSISIQKVITIKKSYETFDKIIYKNYPQMMKRIVDGQVCLYKHDTEIHGATRDFNGNITSGMSYDKTIFYILKEGTVYKLKGNKKKSLKRILTGNSVINEMIDDLDRNLLEYELKKIVAKYNYWLKENNS